MNGLGEDILKVLIKKSAMAESSPTCVKFMDSDVLLCSNSQAITIWCRSSRSRPWSDPGQKHASQRFISGYSPFKQDFMCESHWAQEAIAHPWLELFPAGTGVVYESAVLFPSGTTCSSGILLLSILKRERMLISALTEDKKLVVFASSGENNFLLSENVFHVVLSVVIDSIGLPSSVTITRDSVFVTDTVSDRVFEYRFDSPLMDPVRGIPETAIALWYLQSGLCVGVNTNVTLIRNEGDADVSLQIIGRESNRESQGIVKLLNFRDMSFSTPICSHDITKPFTESIDLIEGLIFVNSESNFRICREDDLDFPFFIKPRVSRVKTHLLNRRRTILLVHNDNVIRFYEKVSGGDPCIVPLEWGTFYDVEAFDSSVSASNIFFGYIQAVSRVFRIISIDGTSGNFREILSIPSLTEKITHVAVRAPLSADDSMQYTVLNERGIIASYNTCTKFTQDIVDLVITEEYLIVLESHRLNISPLYDIHRIVTIPIPNCAKGARIKPFRSKEAFRIIVGSCIVLRTFDFFEGIIWTLFEADNASAVVELSQEPESRDLLVLNSGKIQKRVFELPKPKMQYLFPILRQCSNIEVLPESLRSRLGPLLNISNETEFNRNCDAHAKKFLIEFFFTQEFPDLSISSEALAFTALSETPETIITQTIPQSLGWESHVRKTGIVYWCNEVGKLKEIADNIQKSALQEYMKSKDPTILDNKLALWLAVLGKQQLLASLYKQHGTSCASPVHTRVAQFLSTDFSIPENQSKAVKNAFELVRQKRYGMAVAVFVLAAAFREAADICCRQMADVQLGLMVLKLLRTRIGVDHAKIISLEDDLWEQRIVRPTWEAGDIFFSLLFAWSKQDPSFIRKPEGAVQFCQFESNSEFGPFKIRRTELSKAAIHDFLTVFGDRMRRLNKPFSISSVFPRPSQQERAIELFETGCPELAKRVDDFDSFHPSLRWAVGSQLSYFSE